MTTWLETPETQFSTIDGLAIRFVESEVRDDHALLLSPWPEPGGDDPADGLRQEELRLVFGRECLRFGDEFTLGLFVESGRRLGPRPHGLTDLREEPLLPGGGAETEQAHCLR